ncbi:HAD family acid phosphatase [Streptomyces sp. 1222.5]|uniref:HAD family acid phosphatase n=1 Tax=Streptomyces sp. 1222.5 TaxID=1881026 RepID=UPI003EBB281A
MAANPPMDSSAESTSGIVDYNTWQRDCRTVMGRAMSYLQDRLAHTGGKEKPAIVFDIDNTALETGFNFHYPQPANQPVRKIAHYAQTHGSSLFFITARPNLLKEPTEFNLEHDGYHVDGFYSRGFMDLTDVARYKARRRADIEASGYTIIANIGNSATDFYGGHAERNFKLPDYDGQLS